MKFRQFLCGDKVEVMCYLAYHPTHKNVSTRNCLTLNVPNSENLDHNYVILSTQFNDTKLIVIGHGRGPRH